MRLSGGQFWTGFWVLALLIVGLLTWFLGNLLYTVLWKVLGDWGFPITEAQMATYIGAHLIIFLFFLALATGLAALVRYQLVQVAAGQTAKVLSGVSPQLKIRIWEEYLESAMGKDMYRYRVVVKNGGDTPLSGCNLLIKDCYNYLPDAPFEVEKTPIGADVYPINLKNNFGLNPGQEESAILGLYLHRRAVEQKEPLRLTLNKNWPIKDEEVEIELFQFGEVVFVVEANARECPPLLRNFRCFCDNKGKWNFIEMQERQ